MNKTSVLVFGTGARDQALAEEYTESHHVSKPVYLLGVPGIEKFTKKGKAGRIKTLPELKEKIKSSGFSAVVDFCEEKKIGLVDIGSEGPLDKGLANLLTEKNIPVIGPLKEYVRIENDREFTNKILDEIGVKPEWNVFNPGQYATDNDRNMTAELAKKYVRNKNYQVVVKAGGLAEGKGAFVCNDIRDAENAIDRIIIKKEFEPFGPNSLSAIVEARKPHNEISFFTYLDGKTHIPLKMFAQDFKPAFDNNDVFEMFSYHYGTDAKGIRRGLHENHIVLSNLEMMTLENSLKNKKIRLINPNTGGTGCICPHHLAKEEWITNKILEKIVNPFVEKIYEKGFNYKGVLYFGLNLNPDNSLSVFEVNVRHGDPEFEVIGRKLKTDLFEITYSAWEGKLDGLKKSLPRGEIEFNSRYYVDVVAMTGTSKGDGKGNYSGYPGRYKKGFKIEGLDKIEDNKIVIYFAGTNFNNKGELITDGGRVLHVVSSGGTLEEARKSSYDAIGKIKFLDEQGGNHLRYRKEIL